MPNERFKHSMLHLIKSALFFADFWKLVVSSLLGLETHYTIKWLEYKTMWI